MFGRPPYNFAGPDEGMYMSRSRELQQETSLTREGNPRTHKSGGTEMQRTYICASRREFGPGSACFKQPYALYLDAFNVLHERFPKVFDVGFGHEDPVLHVGGWCFDEHPTLFSLILESYSGSRGEWSVARHKSASFAYLKPGTVLKVRRRMPPRYDPSEMDKDVTAQYELEWDVKIVSVTPLNVSNRALTAKLLTTNTRRTEY